MHQVSYYAARRAATGNGEVALFRCIEPPEGQSEWSNKHYGWKEASSKTLLVELSQYCEDLGAKKNLLKKVIHLMNYQIN